MARMTAPTASILWFDQIGIEDIPRVGGKTASLGEMVRELGPKGVKVPGGFAITAEAYRSFLRESGLSERLSALLEGLDPTKVEDLQRRGRQIRLAMLSADLPAPLERDIRQAYARLSAQTPEGADVAVRSSATAEDLPDASFAGQQETYLNVRGEESLLHHCRRCFASLFTDRAISYRAGRGFDHLQIALSVAVQHMVRSDLA
ncbi:MAG TPA: PEP/pyruvate-binding domain-containing protein, partial [Planctomycetota bacterium]|nr:PEP/pyruvate-binding domain-containing protein [Planctomycetota bacterium]